MTEHFISSLRNLEEKDPEVFHWMRLELERQELGLEMIASENYVTLPVLLAQGSILTNKYAEGYPRKRYYGGCKYIDEIEQLAIDRVKKLFKAEHANVQPHSGSQANMAVYFSELSSQKDSIMGMKLSDGGHLTHGSPVNFSGFLFKSIEYGVDLETERLDYDFIMDLAKKEKPKLIIAGYSAYSRILDFSKFSEIAKAVNATLMVDMAHFAGLVATGLHPSPLGYADYVTSTTHKTLRGPRGGLILCTKEKSKKLNSKIFPGIQGGPLEHIIAAKAVAFSEALHPNFKIYAKQILLNAKALSNHFLEEGFHLVSGGTDNHLLVINLSKGDLAQSNLTGQEAEKSLEEAGITVNKNTIPNEKRSPFVTSGIRVGTAALTSRGMKEDEMKLIGKWMTSVLRDFKNEELLHKIKNKTTELCKKFPIYNT